MPKRVVTFFSDQYRLQADYYLPPSGGAGKLPAIALCGGFSGLRHELLPPYAEKFAQAGYAVLAFDYRGFGGSQGPAGRVIPHEQIEDIRSALTWLEAQDEVDGRRLGLWGTSNGGAHVVYAAGVDARVRCAVGQVGYGDGRDLVLFHRSPEERAAFLTRLHQDRLQRLASGESERVNVLDLLGSPATRAFATTAGQTTVMKVTLQSAEAALTYRPRDVVGDLSSCALLLIGAEKDDLCPIGGYRALYDRAPEPKRWLSYPIGHYEMYLPEWMTRTIDDALTWFSEHL